MLKNYVIEISIGDPAIAGKSIYEYETSVAALASYHQRMGTAMKSAMYDEELIVVVDDHGDVIMLDHFKREAKA